MPSDVIIRAAERRDIPALLALYRHLNPNDPDLSPREAEGSLGLISRYPGSEILVGFAREALVTSCTLIVVPNLTRGGMPYGLIENVVTDAGYRKRGYGQAVLEAALVRAWRFDCYKVMLLTGSKDPATLKFYGGVGFKQSKVGFQVRRIPPRES